MEGKYLCSEKPRKWSFGFFKNKVNMYLQQLAFAIWNTTLPTQFADDRTLCLKNLNAVGKETTPLYSYFKPSFFVKNRTKLTYPIVTLTLMNSKCFSKATFCATNDELSLLDMLESVAVEQSLLSSCAVKTHAKKAPNNIDITRNLLKPLSSLFQGMTVLQSVQESQQMTISCKAMDVQEVDNNNYLKMCDERECNNIVDAMCDHNAAQSSLQPKDMSSKVAGNVKSSRRPKRRSGRKRSRRRRRSAAKVEKNNSRQCEILTNCSNSCAPVTSHFQPNDQVKVDILMVSPDLKTEMSFVMASLEEKVTSEKPFCANAAIAFIIDDDVVFENEKETEENYDETDSCWNSFINPYVGCNFVNGFDCQLSDDELSDVDRLTTINRQWEQAMADVPSGPKTSALNKKVTFVEDEKLIKVHYMCTWAYAYKAARCGPWETVARDRGRFQRRINEANNIIGPILQSDHRANVYHKLWKHFS